MKIIDPYTKTSNKMFGIPHAMAKDVTVSVTAFPCKRYKTYTKADIKLYCKLLRILYEMGEKEEKKKYLLKNLAPLKKYRLII